MTTDRAAQISARLAAATPGPWRWRNTSEPVLQGARTRIVMAFRRMGMNGAQPLFRKETHSAGILDDAGKANLYDYPDADLIAHAPADLAWLLEERAELLRRVEAAEKAGSYENLVTMLALAERERDEALARADAKEPPAT